MEFDLIDRIRSRVQARDDVVLGIGDDAALVRVPAGRELVVAMDTLNVGVHFPDATVPADIGWKALAVNLSDLAAMGAEPAWCTLSLSLPESDEAWLDRFLDGFLELAAQHRVTLVGGDTTQGPLSICVTVHGLVEPGRALRRAGAQVGDDIWVTGTLGDAAAALALLSGPAVDASSPHDARLALEALRQRLDRPIPRVAVGRALAGIAHACIDISDGLLADLDHVCGASGVGMRVALADLPASEALCEAVGADARAGLQATGGDDYELCFTASPDARDALGRSAAETGVAFTRIGEVVSGERVRAFDGNKREWQPPHTGYIHFAD